MRISFLSGKFLAILLSSALLVGCSVYEMQTQKTDMTPPSELSDVDSPSKRNESSSKEVQVPPSVRGQLCYEMDMSDEEPIAVNRVSQCETAAVPRAKLEEIRDGKFYFPIGILSDPVAGIADIFVDVVERSSSQERLHIDYHVARFFIVLHMDGHDLSRGIKVRLAVSFCEESGSPTCGAESWEKEFSHLRRVPGTADVPEELLLVRFLGALNE